MPIEPMPMPCETARADLDRLLEALATEEPEARAGAMFGMPAGTYRRKGFLGMVGDDLVVEVTSEAHADALVVEGAHRSPGVRHAAGRGQPSSAAATTSRASSCTRARCSGPWNDSA